MMRKIHGSDPKKGKEKLTGTGQSCDLKGMYYQQTV
jgi:hypothetical protein